MFDTQGDYRFEVRRGASIYVRKGELSRGEDMARINRSYSRHFPDELRTYIENSDIHLDYTERDYLITPTHIDRVIQILQVGNGDL